MSILFLFSSEISKTVLVFLYLFYPVLWNINKKKRPVGNLIFRNANTILLSGFYGDN